MLYIIGTGSHNAEHIDNHVINAAVARLGYDNVTYFTVRTPEIGGGVQSLRPMLSDAARAESCIIERMRNGDSILYLDFWNASPTKVRHAASEMSDIRITALHHGCTLIPGDWTRDYGDWAVKRDRAELAAIDAMLCGTQYAAWFFQQSEPLVKKVIITGLPFLRFPIDNTVKQEPKRLVFPCRWSQNSKRISMFVMFVAECLRSRDCCDFEFVVTSSDPSLYTGTLHAEAVRMGVKFESFRTRGELRRFMQSCAYSFFCARQELFGYAFLESLDAGCTPLFVNDPSVYYEHIAPWDDAIKFQWDTTKRAAEILASGVRIDPQALNGLMNHLSVAGERIVDAAIMRR